MLLVVSKNRLIRVDWNLSYHYENEVIFRFSFLLIKSKRGFVFKRQNFTVSPSIHLPRNCCHICCKMLRKRTLLYQECLEYLLYFFLRCPCSGLVYKAVRWLQHSVLNPFHAPSSAQVFLCSPDASSRSSDLISPFSPCCGDLTSLFSWEIIQYKKQQHRQENTFKTLTCAE